MLDGLGIGGFGVSYNNLPKRSFGQRKNMDSKLYGCMFPGSLCCTQTEPNGNAPCSLIFLLLYLQYASHDESHGYVQINSDK